MIFSSPTPNLFTLFGIDLAPKSISFQITGLVFAVVFRVKMGRIVIPKIHINFYSRYGGNDGHQDNDRYGRHLLRFKLKKKV